MKVIPLRLQPGDDLRCALEAWMREREEQAGGQAQRQHQQALVPDGAGPPEPQRPHLGLHRSV